MTSFEKLVLRGLWLVIKAVLRTGDRFSGTDEIMWAKDVAEHLGEERLRKI